MDYLIFAKKCIEKFSNSLKITFESPYQHLIIVNVEQDKLSGFFIDNNKRCKIEKIILQSKLELDKRLSAIYRKDKQEVILYKPGLLGGGSGSSKGEKSIKIGKVDHNSNISNSPPPISQTDESINYLLNQLETSVTVGNIEDMIYCLKKIKNLKGRELQAVSEFTILKEMTNIMFKRIETKISIEDLVVTMSEYAINITIKTVDNNRYVSHDDLNSEIKIKLQKIQESLKLHEKTLFYSKEGNKYNDYPFYDFEFRLIIFQAYIENILTDLSLTLKLLRNSLKTLGNAVKLIPYLGNMFEGSIGTDAANVLNTANEIRQKSKKKNLIERYSSELEKNIQNIKDIKDIKKHILNKDFKGDWVIAYHNLVFLDQLIEKDNSDNIFDKNFEKIIRKMLVAEPFGQNHIRIYFKLAYIISKYKDRLNFTEIKKIFPNRAIYEIYRLKKNKFIQKELIFQWCTNKINNKVEIPEDYQPSFILDKKQDEEVYEKIELIRLNTIDVKKQTEEIRSLISQLLAKSNPDSKKQDEVIIIRNYLRNKCGNHQKGLKNNKELDFDCYVEPICIKNENLSLFLKKNDQTPLHSVSSSLTDFLNSDKKILLIVGYAGSGKTFCLNKFEEQLIETDKIPILIQLGHIHDIRLGLIEDYINNLMLVENVDFQLFRDICKNKLIFFLDAYDEAHCKRIQSCRLFNDTLNTNKWLDFKFIITCRNTSTIFNNDDYWKFFTREKDELSEIQLQPFNSEKRIDLFEILSRKYSNNLNIKRINQIIEETPALSSINQTPFILKVIFITWPKNEKFDGFYESKIIEEYIKIYIKRGIDKILDKGGQDKNYFEQANSYCKDFARLMRDRKSTSITYSSEENKQSSVAKLNLNENENQILFDLSPLIIKDYYTYEFLSVSIGEYFNSKVELDEIDGLNSWNQGINEEEIYQKKRNIIVEIDPTDINKYTIDVLKNNKETHIKLFKDLISETNKIKIIRNLKLLIGIDLSALNISDAENLKIASENQVCLSNIGQNFADINYGYIEALENGSIFIRKGEESFQIKEPNQDVTRTLIPSYTSKYLVNYTFNGCINLFIIEDFQCNNEFLLVENVSYFISARFSEDETKLFICYQEKLEYKIISIDLNHFCEVFYESYESQIISTLFDYLGSRTKILLTGSDDQEIQDILISPKSADYMIILKEYLSFDIYYKDEMKRSETYQDIDKNLSQKLLDKIKLVSKYNKSITNNHKVLEKVDLLSKNLSIEDLEASNYQTYVNIQALCEQLISNYLSSRKIVSFHGCIHTDTPATPFCKDILADTTKSTVKYQQRNNVKYVLAVGTRAKILNSVLKIPNVVFYCAYPRVGLSGKSLEEQKVFEENKRNFKNLIDSPIDNIENNKIDEEMHGATYFFKDSNGKHYCFSLKGRQVKEAEKTMNWGIWFGEISNDLIKTRCKKLAEYFKRYDFTFFYDYLVENNLID